ncbi:MAG TPA: cysteine desulfurase family protein [Pirellulales bacterium]|jgi:cysteine desulfurase|nr:cysteine desulfurase family protein [Pirellulales bacterium]
MDRIYLDHNATTPLLEEAAEAMARCQSQSPGNPASQHWAGRQARRALEDAREGIASLLGADLGSTQGDRVVFTSGGTEANNLAIFAFAGRQPQQLVISAIEHPSIAAPAAKLERQGWRVRRLGVSADGEVLADSLPSLFEVDTRLVSVMLGNNETGVLQPIERLAAICGRCGVLLHTDAAQVAGKLPLHFRRLGVSAMTFSAHKFHGPVGIGALVIRGGVEVQPLLHGGFQQSGLRPGTESVALAVGMHAALAAWQRDAADFAQRLTALRDRFERELLTACPDLVVNGASAPRLPQTSNIAFRGMDGEALVMALDLAGVACSTGSACASGSSEPSPTLLAMGLSKELYQGSLRFSFARATTPGEVSEAVRRICKIYNDLRLKDDSRKIARTGRIGNGNSL